nr:synaptobrevin, longin-like domain protein [Tanacetum cinerariifolium]
MIAILEKTEHNIDFHRIVDFLEAFHIRVKTTNLETKILATADGKPRTISESSLWRHLKLNDEEGLSYLPNTKIFENLSLMGYNILPNQRFTFQKGQFSHQWKFLIHTIMQFLSPKSTGFNEFSSNIATALVCLATNKMAAKIKDQDLEISGLKARVKVLEDKDRGSSEPTQEDAPIRGGIMEIGEEVRADKSTKLGNNEIDEMVTILSSIEAANILTS